MDLVEFDLPGSQLFCSPFNTFVVFCDPLVPGPLKMLQNEEMQKHPMKSKKRLQENQNKSEKFKK
jgi:hypothetical protein